jgi:hypothetical protein
MHVLGAWRGALWRSGTGLAAFCLFCPSQSENLVWGFQIGYVLPQLFTTLSFIALVLYWTESQGQTDKRFSPKFLVASILAALGTTYSIAYGILLWPLLVAVSLYLRLRGQAIVSFLSVGAVSTTLYMSRYAQLETHANPANSLGRPLMVLKYSTVYFFSSWGDANAWAVTRTPDLFVLVLVIVMLLLPVLPSVRKFRPFAIQLVLTLLFCLFIALTTALGRLHWGMWSAAVSRYQSVALLFWCSLGLLWLGGAYFVHPRMKLLFSAAQVCLLVIFARGAVRAKYQIELTQRHAFHQKAATAALLTGVFDTVPLSEVYPGMELLARTIPYMKANRLSVFSDSFASKLGKPLDSFFLSATPNECSGAVESVVPVDSSDGPGLRALGWAWDRKHQRRPSSIVVASRGMIVGLGATGEWGPYIPNFVNPGLPTRYDGFIAYAPEPSPGSTVSFYAILRGSPPSACYIDRVVK